ncbi:MAG TPA: hypothetical protein VNX88_20845 [Terriglobales bacterium]|jgi:hypothetical protein|nr:hypothetical protein [Terriglobales bacterium]
MEEGKKPRYTLAGAVWQAPFVILFAYWLCKQPEPGLAVTILGLAAVIMAIRAEHFTRTEEVIWIVVACALCVIEIRAIRHDREVAASEQAEVRKREEENFRTIASGLQASIDNSRSQFAATMEQTKTVLDKTESVSTLTKKNLENITGGESFAFVRPQVEAAGKGPIGLVVWNRGNEVLTGVTIGFSRTNDPNWGSEFFNRYTIGTIAPHDMAMIPITITPQLGDNGIDHYWLMISAQNGTVDETLDFRESKKFPGTWAVRLGVTKRFKIDKNGTASIPVLVREWTDEGGADQKLPNVNTSLKLLKRESKRRH